MNRALAISVSSVSAAALVVAVVLLAVGERTAAFWLALAGGVGLMRGLGDLTRSDDDSQGVRSGLRIEAVGIVIGSIALGIGGVLIVTDTIQTRSGADELVGAIALIGSATGLGVVAWGSRLLR